MKDKTALDVSEELREFIEALVDEVVFNGKPFDNDTKNLLKRFSQSEVSTTYDIEKGISLLFEIAEELKTTNSRALISYFVIIAQKCNLSEVWINKTIIKLGKLVATSKVKSNSDYEITKARWLESMIKKDEAIKKADEVMNARIKAEKDLVIIRESLSERVEEARAIAEQEAYKKIKDTISKKEEKIQENSKLEKTLNNYQQDNEKEKTRFEKNERLLKTEKQKTKTIIWISCLSIIACYAVILFSFCH